MSGFDLGSGGCVGIPRSTDRPNLAAVTAAAEKAIAAIGFKARDADSGRHVEADEDFAGLRIDAPHVAFIVLPRAVPELAVQWSAEFSRFRDRSDGSCARGAGRPRATHRPRQARNPRHCRAREWWRGCRRSPDRFADHRFGNLIEVCAVDGRSDIHRDIELGCRFAAARIGADRGGGFASAPSAAESEK